MEYRKELYDHDGIKRSILIADDEEINREILSAILGDEYDIVLAVAAGRRTPSWSTAPTAVTIRRSWTLPPPAWTA